LTLPNRLNRSLIADLEQSLGTDDILEWIEDECSRIACLGVSNNGCVRLRKSLLESVGIKEIVSTRSANDLAHISPRADGGFTLSLRGLLTKQDRRFWVAHELAHTLWYRKGSNRLPLSKMQARYGEDATIEWLCDRAAAALLVPRMFLNDSKRDSLTRLQEGQLHLIERCASELDVAQRLLSRRVWHDHLRQEKLVLAFEEQAPLAQQELALGMQDVAIKARPRQGLHADNARLRGAVSHKDPSNKAVVRWAAVPDTLGPGLRRKFERKSIPSDALPLIPQSQSYDVSLSGQWRSFLSSCLREQHAKPFKQCTGKRGVNARVGRAGFTVFVQVDCREIVA
jgi:hypothetical protein